MIAESAILGVVLFALIVGICIGYFSKQKKDTHRMLFGNPVIKTNENIDGLSDMKFGYQPLSDDTDPKPPGEE